MAKLRKQEGVSARALEFTILTACRTNEVIGARWGEIEGTVWTIPAERMKTARAHLVPLTAEAATILKTMRKLESEWIFPGPKGSRSRTWPCSRS